MLLMSYHISDVQGKQGSPSCGPSPSPERRRGQSAPLPRRQTRLLETRSPLRSPTSSSLSPETPRGRWEMSPPLPPPSVIRLLRLGDPSPPLPNNGLRNVLEIGPRVRRLLWRRGGDRDKTKKRKRIWHLAGIWVE